MHVALITNPVAGRNSGLRAATIAARVLEDGGWSTEVLLTSHPGHAFGLARQAAATGFDLVCACGGDGTLSEVVGGLLDTGVPAGFIPAGTGNDFARTVGIARTPAQAARQMLGGGVVVVDLLEVKGGEQWGLNILGVGLDAAVAQRMSRRRRLTSGLVAYLTALAQELFRYPRLRARVTVDGEVWSGDALLVAVANATCYGGGMKIAPQASITDGMLDVVVVEHISRSEFVRNFPRVLRGTHLSHPAVHTWRGKSAVIETQQPQPALIDGDIRAATPLEVRVAQGRGRLWLPSKADAAPTAAEQTGF